MPTVKSVIVPDVSTTLTTAYTNTSGSGATLKAVNAIGTSDPQTWTTTTSVATEWTYFGTSNPSFMGPTTSSSGNNAPIPVQLTDDRVLLLWTPANTHVGAGVDYLAGTVLHSQIVEWTGTAYRAGPIVNITLPFAYFNSQTVGPWTNPDGLSSQGSVMLKAATLSSTKVAIVLRYSTGFHLIRVPISGNSVDQTNVANFALSGATAFNSTTAFDFDVAPVLGNSNKVVVLGSNGTNWRMQSYNIPDTGAITVNSALFNTGLAHTTYFCALSPLSASATGTTTTYIVAANTGTNVTISLQNITFDSTTADGGTGFAGVGTVVTFATTATRGIQAQVTSSDATANAVVAYIDSVNNQNMYFFRQTSLTQASNTSTSVALASSSASRVMRYSYPWGTSRAVFQSEINGLVAVDNTGTATPLVTATESASTATALTYWYPFNSRPLYTISDTTPTFVGRVPQFMSRTGIISAISVGTATFTGNYFPYGHIYNGNASWSEKAQCWMIGQGGRIYAVNESGVVLNEVSLYNLAQVVSTNSILLSIKQLAVTPQGKILVLTDTQGSHPSYWNGIYWPSLSATAYGYALAPVTSAGALNSAALLSAPTNFSYYVVADLAIYTDYNGIERALGLYVNASSNAFIAAVRFDGGQWSTVGNTSVSSTTLSASYNFGVRPNIAIIQDSPADAYNQTGLWRFIGLLGTNTQNNAAFQGISTTAYSDAQITTQSVNTTINNATTAVYSAVKAETTISTAVAYYDPTALLVRYYWSYNGRLTTNLYGSTISGANTLQFCNVICSKFGFVVAPCSTNTSNVVPFAYAFDAVTAVAGPKFTLTGNSGNGWITLFRNGQNRLEVWGNNINTRYAVPGPDTALLHVSISSPSNDFFTTSVLGQPVNTGTSAAYRNTDVYFVPNGYSVKLKTNLASSLSAMLSVVEDA
jgi:hypothetical protein